MGRSLDPPRSPRSQGRWRGGRFRPNSALRSGPGPPRRRLGRRHPGPARPATVTVGSGWGPADDQAGPARHRRRLRSPRVGAAEDRPAARAPTSHRRSARAADPGAHLRRRPTGRCRDAGRHSGPRPCPRSRPRIGERADRQFRGDANRTGRPGPVGAGAPGRPQRETGNTLVGGHAPTDPDGRPRSHPSGHGAPLADSPVAGSGRAQAEPSRRAVRPGDRFRRAPSRARSSRTAAPPRRIGRQPAQRPPAPAIRGRRRPT